MSDANDNINLKRRQFVLAIAGACACCGLAMGQDQAQGDGAEAAEGDGAEEGEGGRRRRRRGEGEGEGSDGAGAEGGDGFDRPRRQPITKGRIDAGPVSGYAADGVFDTYVRSAGFYLIRWEKKLVAMQSRCTHKGCTVKPADGDFSCPCHHSIFNGMGARVEGQAPRSLPHYAISINDDKHVIVDNTVEFEEKDWEADGAWVAVE